MAIIMNTNKLILVVLLNFALYSSLILAEDRPSLLLLSADSKFVATPPEQYIVLPGDNLHKVLSLFVTNPHQATEFWGEQTPQIHIGDIVSLLDLGDKQYAIQIKRGREVKLSPMTRIIPEERTQPTIPLGQIQHFLNRPRVLTEYELEDAGYIIANAADTLLISKGHTVYARGLSDWNLQTRYAVVRLGNKFTDPYTDEVLAHEAIYLGTAALKHSGDPVTLDIVSSERAISNGDLLIPLEDDQLFVEDFTLSKPDYIDGETAKVIAVVDDSSNIGQFQIVVVNKGYDDGIERGHVLVVKTGGREIKDSVTAEIVTLPQEIAANLMVFKSFNHVSYALVMRSRRHFGVMDEVAIP
jgi:hypothetical protein